MARRFNPPQAPATGLPPHIAQWLRQTFAEIAADLDGSRDRVTALEGGQTDQEQETTPPFTIEGNSTDTPRVGNGVFMDQHTVLARLDGQVLSHPFATLAGSGLTYDPGTGSVSADDQLAALTASLGVVRELDNIREADQIAQSVKVNATGSVARPVPLPFASHTFFANVGSGIVARSLATFFGAGITYDELTGTVSVDSIAVGLTGSNEGLEDDGSIVGIADNGVSDAKLTDMPANSLKVRLGGAGTGDPENLSLIAHSFPAHVGAGLTAHPFSTLAGSGLSYDPGSGSLSADDQLAALTASLGVTRVVDDFRLDSVSGNSMLANQGATLAPPTPFVIGAHSLPFRGAGDVGARFIATLMGNGLSYDPGTELINATLTNPVLRLDSVDQGEFSTLDFQATSTIEWFGGVFSGNGILTASIVANSVGTVEMEADSVTNSIAANMPARTFKCQAGAASDDADDLPCTQFSLMGRPGSGDLGPVQLGTHSIPARIAGDIVGYSLANLAGNGLSYNTGTGAIDASSSGGALLNVTGLSGSGTHNFNASTNRVVVHIKGGGGGGRGVGASLDTSGGGGGEGGYAIVHRTGVGSSMSFSVGSGGSGGSGANNGSSGGSSSATIAGSTYTAGGGSGGAAQLGGLGGTVSGSTVGRVARWRGAPGEGLFKIFLDTDTTTRSGAGGGSGAGRGHVDGGSAGAGTSAESASGAGGAAALSLGSAANGGAGGSGYIVVYEYS
jgi:hypothetical protein